MDLHLIFSSDDWSPALKTSKYHVAINLSRRGTVYFFNSPGLRNIDLLSAGDWKRAITKLRDRIGESVKEEEGKDPVRIVTPIVVPNIRFWKLGINDRLYRRSINRILDQWPGANVYQWIFHPLVDFSSGRPGVKSIYYCVDEHSLFEKVDTSFVRRREENLLRSCDLAVFTSRNLYESKGKGIEERRKSYVPHGVDLENFRILPPAEELVVDRERYGTVLGFFGLIHDWIDLELLEKIARRFPRVLIVMIGNAKVDVSRLKSLPNVALLGPVPYGKLAGYAAHFDVGLIPFKVSEMTRFVNPLKAREYLACGVPVLSTSLPEIVGLYDRFVDVCKDHESFLEMLERRMTDGYGEASTRNDVRRIVSDESWSSRIEGILKTIGSQRGQDAPSKN